MQSLLRRGTSFLSGSTKDKPDGFTTVSSHDALFPKVDPAVDGEDCDKDCATCTVRYPAKFDIDTKDKLYGHVDGWATHLLVATGKSDWVRDVADEKGSVMEAIEKHAIKPRNGKMKLSASNMPVPDEYHHHEPGSQPTNVLLLPSFTIVEHVTPALASDLVRYFVDPAPTTTTPLNASSSSSSSSESNTPQQQQSSTEEQAEKPSETETQAEKTDISSLTPLRSRPCPHAAVILLCSQRTRDARCGQSAPLLKREFERHLRAQGLYRDMDDERPGGVGIYFISHVGGHKYSANVMVYRRRDFDWWRKKGTSTSEAQPEKTEEDKEKEKEEGAAQCIWLARVKPEDCEGIIKHTVLKGKVIKPGYQLRGGFDRERGLISW
ncbi:hypothetical protein DTO166G4_3129 [Paecilomyces variotii]|nr:hypothetical protein DTO166G4_3129 [Paecilomyces variotii]KAJ9231629.1 hypothetical protein DTO166G5_6687 [Paecilomyces variotii]KAJ9374517.1 hypothetical protein DTO282E5_600 [Paecilomyces variotii]